MFSIFDISYYCYRHVYKLSNLYWFCLTGNVGECVTSPVLSHCNKNWKWWTDQCYSYMLQLSFIWQAQENASLRREGGLTQKTRGEEKNPPYPSSVLAPLFLCVCVCVCVLFFFFFLLPLSIPYVNWASHEGCLFYLLFSLQYSDLPLFYFPGLFPCLSFSQQPPPFQAHFSYFNYLTKQLTHTHNINTIHLYMLTYTPMNMDKYQFSGNPHS